MSEVTLLEIQDAERQIAGMKAAIEMKEAVNRLAANPDFKKLINEGFLTEECARFTHLSTDPALSPDDRANALGQAQAAGHLKRYLSITYQMGAAAENSIKDHEENLEELKREFEAD